MSDPTGAKESVLATFRGHAENLAAAADKAAAQEAELAETITSEYARLAPLVKQAKELNAEVADSQANLAELQRQRDDAHANAEAAAAQGAYAQSVVALAEKSSTTTLTDGQLDAGEVAGK